VRLEGLGKLKSAMTSSGIEHATSKNWECGFSRIRKICHNTEIAVFTVVSWAVPPFIQKIPDVLEEHIASIFRVEE
jgi:hypothetical protein